MSKVTVPTILSSYLSTEELNSILQILVAAIENTLSRDGTSPNQMSADLDMNSNKILNLGLATADTDVPTFGQIRGLGSGYVVQNIERQVATAAQTVFTLANMVYQPGSNNLAVYKDGLRVFSGFGYTETSASVITFATPMSGSEVLEFVTNDYLATIAITSPPSIAWNILTGVPAYATRWPTYAEVTGKPTTFAPSTHTHATSDITTGVSFQDAFRGVYVQASTPTADRVGSLWFY